MKKFNWGFRKSWYRISQAPTLVMVLWSIVIVGFFLTSGSAVWHVYRSYQPKIITGLSAPNPVDTFDRSVPDPSVFHFFTFTTSPSSVSEGLEKCRSSFAETDIDLSSCYGELAVGFHDPRLLDGIVEGPSGSGVIESHVMVYSMERGQYDCTFHTSQSVRDQCYFTLAQQVTPPTNDCSKIIDPTIKDDCKAFVADYSGQRDFVGLWLPIIFNLFFLYGFLTLRKWAGWGFFILVTILLFHDLFVVLAWGGASQGPSVILWALLTLVPSLAVAAMYQIVLHKLKVIDKTYNSIGST